MPFDQIKDIALQSPQHLLDFLPASELLSCTLKVKLQARQSYHAFKGIIFRIDPIDLRRVYCVFL